MTEWNELRLLAEDPAGLQILSAAVQDALARPSDMIFAAQSLTFGLEVDRFQWEQAGRRGPYFRRRSVLAFAGVLSARSKGMPRSRSGPLVVLDVTFDAKEPAPAGLVCLIFAGGAEVHLDVECLDVTLVDRGPSWPTRRKPNHERAR